MRTMLILVLLCSLAQFAIANNVITPDGCGTIYNCYAPQSCLQAGKTLAQSSVREVDAFNPIFETCNALIKFHAYADYWMDVTIESFDDPTKSIVFAQTQNGQEVAVFSCLDEGNGKVKGSFGPKKAKEVRFTKETKIKCNFEVKLSKKTDKIFLPTDASTNVLFVIDGSPSRNTNTVPATGTCDPSFFKFYEEKSDPQRDMKVYRKVEYKPGQYFCEDPDISEMQYRPEGEDDYKTVDPGSLRCDGQNFKLKVETVEVDLGKATDVTIRCVAEVKYFCDINQVKEKTGTQTPLVRIPGNKKTKIASEIKCDYHLFVGGKLKSNKVFECNNYGNKQSWTVDGQPLSDKGPEIYCSKTVDCKLIYKLPETSVIQGTVDSNNFPTCPGTGVLSEENGEKVDISKTRCDDSIGKVKYTVESGEKTIEKTTKFKCTYPPQNKEIVDEQVDKKLKIGIPIASGVGGFITALAIGGLALVTRWNIRKHRKRMEKQNNQLFVQFAMSRDEKAEALKKMKPCKNTKNQKSSSLPTKLWNNMIYARQYITMRLFSMDGQEGKYPANKKVETIEKDTTPSVIDTKPNLLRGGPRSKYKKTPNHTDACYMALAKVFDKKEEQKEKNAAKASKK